MLKFREAVSEDVLDLIMLYKQLLPKDSYDNIKIESTLKEIIEIPNIDVFVLEKDLQIIASCTVAIITNLTHECHPFAIIENVIIKENERGSGYGQILIENVKDFVINKDCYKIMLQTRRKEKYVLDFYKKCGFDDTISTGFMIDLEGTIQ